METMKRRRARFRSGGAAKAAAQASEPVNSLAGSLAAATAVGGAHGAGHHDRGGRLAEEAVYDQLSTGANNDLVGVTELARKMVREWGMSDRISGGAPTPISAHRARGQRCSTRWMLGSLINDWYRSGPGSAGANR